MKIKLNFFNRFFLRFTETVGVRTEIDDSVSAALVLQKIFGQQVLDPNWSWKKYGVLHLLNLFLFIYVFIGTLETLRTKSDPELITEAYYTMIMIFVFPIKLMVFLNRRSIFQKLYIEAKTSLVDIFKENDQYEVVLRKTKKIVYGMFAIVIIPCSNVELVTLFYYIKGDPILLSRSTMILMPMRWPYFELAWFLHSIFLIQVSTTIILDLWYVLLIYLLYTANDCLVRNIGIERKEGETNYVYAKRLNVNLEKFYKSHVKQVRFLNMLNYMYKWLAVVPLGNAALCICIILLTISKEANWNFLPHVLPMLAEIFAYNWFGEQIKTKAAEINDGLLKFDWTNLSLKNKKNYFIIITYVMKKNFGIRTATGSDLSLITMTAVLKASYQAFTVLQTTRD